MAGKLKKRFDNVKVTKLLQLYCEKPTYSLRVKILSESESLVDAAMAKMKVFRDREDVKQECFLTLVRGLQSYKPGKGRTAFPFFWTMLCNTIRKQFSATTRRENSADWLRNNLTAVYMQPVEPSIERSVNSKKLAAVFVERPEMIRAYFPELAVAYEVIGRDSIEQFLTELAGKTIKIPTEQRMEAVLRELQVYHLLSGPMKKREQKYRVKEIAKKLGLSEDWVSQMYRRAERRIKSVRGV